MGDTILRVDDIQKFYGNKGNLTKAIDHISFSVRKGEFLGIMGASGSGKTTLLNCISTIDTVTSGHIYVEGKDITALHGAQLADFRGKKLGFIFQNFNLLDTLTAYENISLALSIAGAKPSEIEQRIPQIAQALNIQDVLGKYPYQMSGGQQQRVAAARAMVTNPAIVLADEPTGALDSNSSRMLLTMLTELNERLSATILMVTHLIAERNVPVLHVAARLSDNFMPLMSSNWIAVLLISTFFTSSLKTDSSNNSSGGVLESFFWMSLVFCRIFSDVLDISFRESCCFLSLICCSMAALRSINCGSSI